MLILTGLVGFSPALADDAPAAPAKVTNLRFDVAADDGTLALHGPDARRQLLVTGTAADGRDIDLTRDVTFQSEPPTLLQIDDDGLAIPAADGDGTIIATTADGQAAKLAVRVESFDEARPINFKHQIVPIFTKYGCNGGGCHGKSGGQNGFRLSLLGFYPQDDYEYLVKEAFGRRVFPPAPQRSLLLTKPTGDSPHGGGTRIDKESDEYRLMYRWIEQGMPYGSETDPVVTGIRCVPQQRVMGQQQSQQVALLADYSDGSVKDVTRMALYESNESELAEVAPSGLVTTLDLSGQAAIMARYQGHVATFRATIPLGASVDDLPPTRNFIDEAVFAQLTTLGIPPSDVCDDATFLRRVMIDIAGITPTEAEVSTFLADADPNKRDVLIDRLLESPEYADHFANKWSMVLRNKKRTNEDLPGTLAFHRWLTQSIFENKPYDEFVSDILTASGDASFNPPVIWYREVADAENQVENVAQLFLGVRIQCARCHHHPFEKWSQNDYYSLAAFFSTVGRKAMPAGTSNQVRDRRIFHNQGTAQARNPRNGQMLKPAGLGSEPFEILTQDDPRIQLAEWMAEPDNPFFARSLVNRYWKHFLGRGIVEPEDDMRATNPPSNPQLLDALARHFVEAGFDMKDLVRTICRSTTYQLSALPNAHNLQDKQNYSRFSPERLTAEALYDAFHQVTGTTASFGNTPKGTSAVQLADASVGPYFLKVFGMPQGDTACECERSQEANLAQSLHLLNSKELQDKLAHPSGRAAQWAAMKDRPAEESVREMYRWVFAREPVQEELDIALAHIEKHKDDPKIAYEDLLWALVNTKEFLFNH